MSHELKHNKQRVLVIAPAWVGDMVMAQTLFTLLKQQGAAHLAVAAPKWTLAVAARMPEVDECILADFAHGQLAFAERRRLGQSLTGRFDVAIVLPKSFKAALLPFFAKIPQRIGYIGEMRYGLVNDRRRLDKIRLPKTIDRFAYLGLNRGDSVPVLSYPQLHIDRARQQQLIDEFALQKPLIALCPGAEYGPSKQWPTADFAAIARHAADNGLQVMALGSPKDHETIVDIIKYAPKVLNLAGKTSITDAIDLLSLANAVLTNDSGLMHIAAAVNVPVFAVYGSTTQAMTPPLSDKVQIFADDTLACRPCFKRHCPKSGDDFMACMLATRPATVWQAIEHVVGGHRR